MKRLLFAVLLVLAGCHAPPPQTDPEAVAMIQAAGLSVDAQADGVPPLLQIVGWLANDYHVPGIIPFGYTLALMEWCRPTTGTEAVKFEARPRITIDAFEDPETAWEDRQTIFIIIPDSSVAVADVRGIDADGNVGPYSEPSCIYRDTTCTVDLGCGPESWEVQNANED